MTSSKPQPVESFENLRDRVERLVRGAAKPARQQLQVAFDFPLKRLPEWTVDHPSRSISSFLNFLTDALPDGDVYFFGGVLRDLALLGRRGFNSDIDLVVEGSWEPCLNYLESLGAQRNKFGGYRLQIAGWQIDIWKADETWAVRQGLVLYRGIGSLTETTVLNWDAILMSWRTRQFICRPSYLEDIQSRLLSIVLHQNPDPLGMVVRVFRHLCTKDARSITASTADYLASAVSTWNYEAVRAREIQSYGSAVIELPIYRLFEHYENSIGTDRTNRFGIASEWLRRELGFDSVPLYTGTN